jgi:phage terminase large subunit
MQKMSSTFRKEWFNPLYFIIKELIEKRGVSEIYAYGGKSSSKTISICQYLAVRGVNNQRSSLIFRKESATIKTTTKESLKLAINLTKTDSAYNVQDFEVKGLHGNKITFRGLDNEGKVKGIESFHYVFWDEINQFTFEEYSQAILSFRGEVAKCFFGAWNPVSEESWVKKKLVDTEIWLDTDLKLPNPKSFVKISKDGNKALIKTNYKDNYWTVGSPFGTYGYHDEKLIARYEKLKEVNPIQYDIDVEGNWGVIGAENPYCWGFNEAINMGSPEYNKREKLLLGFDYNIGNSCTVGQIYEYQRGKWKDNTLKEYHSHGGDGDDLEALCERVAREWGGHGELHFTGDSSGNSGNALTEGSVGGNQLVLKYLKLYCNKYQGHQRVRFEKKNANPRTALSGWIMSALMKLMGTDSCIDSSCTILKTDLKQVQRLSDGSLDKIHANKKDIGHVMDTKRYIYHAFGVKLWHSYRKTIEIPKELIELENKWSSE